MPFIQTLWSNENTRSFEEKKNQEQEEQEEIEPLAKHQAIEEPPSVQKPMVQTPKSTLPLHVRSSKP